MISHFVQPMNLFASLLVLVLLTAVCLVGALVCHQSARAADNEADAVRYGAARMLAGAFTFVFGVAAAATAALMWALS
ncbi:MAG: hypothetical protein AB7P37_21230 [Ramlibacter sp.]